MTMRIYAKYDPDTGIIRETVKVDDAVVSKELAERQNQIILPEGTALHNKRVNLKTLELEDAPPRVFTPLEILLGEIVDAPEKFIKKYQNASTRAEIETKLATVTLTQEENKKSEK